jgi:hypothetical protein
MNKNRSRNCPSNGIELINIRVVFSDMPLEVFSPPPVSEYDRCFQSRHVLSEIRLWVWTNGPRDAAAAAAAAAAAVVGGD